MPFTQNAGAKIYWDSLGSGDPILLIMGLGWTSDMWFRTRPVLSARYRTIALDNRGVGRSDVPPGPYSIALMASDALAVLDEAHVPRAHIFGVSMGGMIAQEFALQYPARVRSLVLGCTYAGGPTAVRADQRVLDVLAKRAADPDEYGRALNPFIYDSATPPERIAEDMAIRRQWWPDPAGFMAQLQAIMAWECYSRLPQISAPTLILHGESDQLIPPANADVISNRIRGSQLIRIPHASHVFSTDQPAPSHSALFAFLSAQ